MIRDYRLQITRPVIILMSFMLLQSAQAQWPRPVQTQGTVHTNDTVIFADNTGKYIRAGTNVYATGLQGEHADTAYGWGDHAVAGYLTISSNINVSQIMGAWTNYLLGMSPADVTNGAAKGITALQPASTNGWVVGSHSGLVSKTDTNGWEVSSHADFVKTQDVYTIGAVDILLAAKVASTGGVYTTTGVWEFKNGSLNYVSVQSDKTIIAGGMNQIQIDSSGATLSGAGINSWIGNGSGLTNLTGANVSGTVNQSDKANSITGVQSNDIDNALSEIRRLAVVTNVVTNLLSYTVTTNLDMTGLTSTYSVFNGTYVPNSELTMYSISAGATGKVQWIPSLEEPEEGTWYLILDDPYLSQLTGGSNCRTNPVTTHYTGNAQESIAAWNEVTNWATSTNYYVLLADIVTGVQSQTIYTALQPASTNGWIVSSHAGFWTNAQLFSGAGTTGLVGSIIADAGKFLRADGSWISIAGGDMLAANNLSDLVNPAVARTNLGLSGTVTTNGANISVFVNNSGYLTLSSNINVSQIMGAWTNYLLGMSAVDVTNGATRGATALQPASTNGWEVGSHSGLVPKTDTNGWIVSSHAGLLTASSNLDATKVTGTLGAVGLSMTNLTSGILSSDRILAGAEAGKIPKIVSVNPTVWEWVDIATGVSSAQTNYFRNYLNQTNMQGSFCISYGTFINTAPATNDILWSAPAPYNCTITNLGWWSQPGQTPTGNVIIANAGTAASEWNTVCFSNVTFNGSVRSNKAVNIAITAGQFISYLPGLSTNTQMTFAYSKP